MTSARPEVTRARRFMRPSATGLGLPPPAAPGLPYGVAGSFTTVAVLSGSVLWALLFVILDGHTAADTLGFAAVGLAFMGLPLLLLGFNLALAWTMVVGRIAAPPR